MQPELAVDELLVGEGLGAEVRVLLLLAVFPLLSVALPPAQGQRLHVCWQKLAIHVSLHLPQAACSSRFGAARVSTCAAGTDAGLCCSGSHQTC